MILSRYWMRELAASTLAVSGILLLIFLSNSFIKLIARVAAGRMSGHVLGQLLWLQIPYLLGLLLPLALYLAIFLVVGRWCANQELSAMSACGYSTAQQTRAVMQLGLIVAVIVGAMSLWINPALVAQQNQLMHTDGARLLLETLMPGQFKVSPDGKRVFYVQNIKRHPTRMQNVFVASMPSSLAKPWDVVSARTGLLKTIDGTAFVVVQSGHRYQGQVNRKDMNIMQFNEYGLRIDAATQVPKRQRVEAAPLATLWQNKWRAPEAMAELQWRAVLPLTALAFVYLALPFSRVQPRQGRYARLLPAVVVYLVYSNSLFVLHNALAKAKLNPWLGLWWMPLLLVLLGWGLRHKPWRMGLRRASCRA